MTSIITPINVDRYEELLKHFKYKKKDIKFLVDGFRTGFDIGYRGPENRRDTSANIPFTVGVSDKFDMWNKLMKEVKLGRVAGPFNEIPFDNFMQSPIGLVPKAGNKTRLIFHLSYNFLRKQANSKNKEFLSKNSFAEKTKNADGKADHKNEEDEARNSLNDCIPENYCSIHYNDLDYAIRTCLKLKEFSNSFEGLFLAKSDLTSAFKILPIKRSQYKWLVMKANHPITNKVMFFVEKTLPFGASSSCFLFQSFSNSLKFLIERITGKQFQVTNYLDDYLFIETSEDSCNRLVQDFIQLCEYIGCPISYEKTEWASQYVIFLGILLDVRNFLLCIPEDKKLKAIGLVRYTITKRKLTVKQIQKLTGTLNFLNRAMVPGRAFTRRMYSKLEKFQEGKHLKFYHHVNLDAEFLDDCRMWEFFLTEYNAQTLCRPFLEIQGDESADILEFFSDASASKKITSGFGCFFKGRWTFAFWEPNYISTYKPSIEYLELFALCMGVLTWGHLLKNRRVIIFTDNQSVRDMVNSQSSSCKNCMVLIRILTLNSLYHNRKIFVRHVKGSKNVLADSLSRGKFSVFWHHAPMYTKAHPDSLPSVLWPASKLWKK